MVWGCCADLEAETTCHNWSNHDKRTSGQPFVILRVWEKTDKYFPMVVIFYWFYLFTIEDLAFSNQILLSESSHFYLKNIKFYESWSFREQNWEIKKQRQMWIFFLFPNRDPILSPLCTLTIGSIISALRLEEHIVSPWHKSKWIRTCKIKHGLKFFIILK